MNTYCAYIHARPNGVPFYVGKAKDLIRPYCMRRNKHHNNIVAKYGAHNIKVRIIRCKGEAHALAMEIQIIKDLREVGVQLTNLTDGGEGVSGFVHTDESKEKNRLAHKGKKLTTEHKAKISAAGKGHTRGKMSVATKEKLLAANKGKKHTAEHKAKISASLMGNTYNKGKKLTTEHKAKISASLTGRAGHKHTDATRAKLSAALIGYKHTDATKEKMSVAQKNRREKALDY